MYTHIYIYIYVCTSADGTYKHTSHYNTTSNPTVDSTIQNNIKQTYVRRTTR